MLNSLLFIGLFSFYGCSEEDIDYQQFFKNILIEEKGNVKSGTSLDDYTSELLLADPYILCEDDGYYAYGTGVNCSYGLEVFYSNDLYTWENCGYVISKDIVDIEGAFWAPEVYKVGNKYLMYFANNNNGSYKIYVAQSDSPRGPFTDLSVVKSNAIDPTLFFDKDGAAYLFSSGFFEGTQRIYRNKLSEDLKLIDGEEELCVLPYLPWEKAIVEGPSVFTYSDNTYLTYSGDGYTSQAYSIGIASYNNETKEWIKEGTPILFSNGIWYGIGHCSVFYDHNQELRLVFHAHNSVSSVHPRIAYIGKLYIIDNHCSVGNTFIVPKVK